MYGCTACRPQSNAEKSMSAPHALPRPRRPRRPQQQQTRPPRHGSMLCACEELRPVSRNSIVVSQEAGYIAPPEHCAREQLLSAPQSTDMSSAWHEPARGRGTYQLVASACSSRRAASGSTTASLASGFPRGLTACIMQCRSSTRLKIRRHRTALRLAAGSSYTNEGIVESGRGHGTKAVSWQHSIRMRLTNWASNTGPDVALPGSRRCDML
jgi:hypothetical protein